MPLLGGLFGGGGFSQNTGGGNANSGIDKSNESTTITNTTTNTTTDASALAADNNSVALRVGDGSTVSMLDGGAVAAAFNFGGNVAREAFNFGGDALEYGESITLAAFDSLGETFESSTSRVAAASAQLVDKVTIDSGERMQKMMQAVLLAAVVIAGIMAWRNNAR